MLSKLIKLNLAIFTLFFIFANHFVYANNEAQENTPASTITDVSINNDLQSTEVVIVVGQSISSYTENTLAGTDSTPPRMYLDIEDVILSADIQKEYSVNNILEKIRLASNDGGGVRLVFDSASTQLFSYEITPVESGLKIIFSENTDRIVEEGTDDTLDALIESSVAELDKKPLDARDTPVTEAENVENSFRVSGFDKEYISVDFYKIDLHNVFRLFREVSGMNIIVDENVKGSLTLSLSDVPWDFALDIVLNLSNLKKEERFNTIVIYPASSTFSWPERTSLDNLEIEADTELINQETLIVQQASNQPKEIMLAQQLLKQAKKAEKANDFEDAAEIYEKALTLWPANSKISNRLSTLYLVELGMNAKAVYHASNVLKAEPQNDKAALYAAIGSANMDKNEDAIDYFNQSISNLPPMQEALISYAAYAEQNTLYAEALKLIDKHNQYYGESMTTMLSRARLFDKMGDSKKATEQYNALLNSGYQLRPDLKKYIRDRIAAGDIHK